MGLRKATQDTAGKIEKPNGFPLGRTVQVAGMILAGACAVGAAMGIYLGDSERRRAQAFKELREEVVRYEDALDHVLACTEYFDGLPGQSRIDQTWLAKALAGEPPESPTSTFEEPMDSLFSVRTQIVHIEGYQIDVRASYTPSERELTSHETAPRRTLMRVNSLDDHLIFGRSAVWEPVERADLERIAGYCNK